MTSTEDLLRDRLARLAPTVPADAAAYDGIGRRITHRRRQRAAGRVAAVAAVALAVAGTGVLLTSQEAPTDYSVDGGEPAASPAVPGQQGRVAFGDASFEVPPGWEVTSLGEGTVVDVSGTTPGGSYETLCVGEPGDEVDSCAVALYHGDVLPGAEMAAYEDHAAWGWSHQTDVMQCPFTPMVDGELDGVRAVGGDGTPTVQGERPVGDRTAVFDQWSVECDSGPTFAPRAWHLAESDLLILDVIGHDETEELLASFRFDEPG